MKTNNKRKYADHERRRGVLERMIITDVARMQSGACIAGYTIDLTTPIRPVRASGGGLDWDWIAVDNGLPLRPLSVIDIKLNEPRPEPPHSEDVVIHEPVQIDHLGVVPREKVPVALERIAFSSINDAFGDQLIEHRFLAPDAGIRSIANVRVSHVQFIAIEAGRNDNGLRIRIEFADGAGVRYRLPVTDIALRSECFRRLVDQRKSITSVGYQLRSALNAAKSLYFRIGAGRSFQASDQHLPGCYLLITAIHSVPDYRRLPWPELFESGIPVDWNPLPDSIVTSMTNS
jgi:hypothetical protein